MNKRNSNTGKTNNNRDIILIKRGCPYCEKVLDNNDFKNSRDDYKVVEINSLGDEAKKMIDKYSIMYIPTIITISNEILEGYDDVINYIKEHIASNNVRYVNKLRDQPAEELNDESSSESSNDKFNWKRFMFLPPF